MLDLEAPSTPFGPPPGTLDRLGPEYCLTLSEEINIKSHEGSTFGAKMDVHGKLINFYTVRVSSLHSIHLGSRYSSPDSFSRGRGWSTHWSPSSKLERHEV